MTVMAKRAFVAQSRAYDAILRPTDDAQLSEPVREMDANPE